MIAQLFRHTANFPMLLAKPGMVQLLARTLREEGKKSTDVAVNAVTVFFSLSNFSVLHGLIMDNQVGAMTLDLVALEIQRTELRTREHGLSPSEIAAKVWRCKRSFALHVCCMLRSPETGLRCIHRMDVWCWDPACKIR